MSTNPPGERKLRFANPQPLNPDTRVGHAIVDGGVRVGDYDNRTLFPLVVLERCAELGLALDQAQQLATQDGHDIFYVLGLDPQTLKRLRSRPWLSMAAQTCSVSYRSVLTPELLLEVLSTGNAAPSVSAPVSHFIDEAPLQVVVMSIEDAAHESGLDISVIWRNVAQIAVAMSSTRLAPLA